MLKFAHLKKGIQKQLHAKSGYTDWTKFNIDKIFFSKIVIERNSVENSYNFYTEI